MHSLMQFNNLYNTIGSMFNTDTSLIYDISYNAIITLAITTGLLSRFSIFYILVINPASSINLGFNS